MLEDVIDQGTTLKASSTENSEKFGHSAAGDMEVA